MALCFFCSNSQSTGLTSVPVARKCVCVSCSVMSDSVQPHGLEPVWLLCRWNSPEKNTVVAYRFLLQGIFMTHGSKPVLLHFR